MSSVGFLTTVLNPIIRAKTAQAMSSNFKTLLPTVLSSILEQDLEIPNLGVLYTEYLAAPIINEEGMQVDLEIRNRNRQR